MSKSINPFNANPGKITDLSIDPDKLRRPLRDLPAFLAACNPQLQATIQKANSTNAQLTIIPHQDSNYADTLMPETAVVFKLTDSNLTTLATKWNAEPPKGTIAYATFSKVQLYDSEMDGLLLILKGATHQLLLRAPLSSHTWKTNPKTVYCRNSKLFVLHAEGYSMMIDFGV